MESSIVVLLSLQIAAPLLKLGFGGVSVGLARRLPAGRAREAWLLAGLVFLLVGASNVAQGVAAAWAYRAGAGSAVYEAYLRWSPVGNQSRTFAVIACAGMLAALPFLGERGSPGRRLRVALVVLGAGTLLGAAAGWWEGGLTNSGHWPLKAAYDAVELLVLLAALGATLFAQVVDRLFWAALAVYAFNEAWNVIWFSALAWLDTPGAWAPRPVFIQIYAATAYAAMLALALRRRWQARRGVEVPAPLAHFSPGKARLVG